MKCDRTEKLIGSENIKKLENLNILLVGLGGVGGITFEMLVRSNIKCITIIDYDSFELSNLNRQLLSTKDNIGEFKTNEAKKRALNINKDCNINVYNEKFDKNLISRLDENYDYIIDAIDDLNAKVLLIKYAIKNKIKIISSCGTGNRLDPSKLEITNIWKTSYDPLAKKLRNLLRKEKINYKLPVVSSIETPLIKEKGAVGSMAIVPNAAGIMLASYVINDCIKN